MPAASIPKLVAPVGVCLWHQIDKAADLASEWCETRIPTKPSQDTATLTQVLLNSTGHHPSPQISYMGPLTWSWKARSKSRHRFYCLLLCSKFVSTIQRSWDSGQEESGRQRDYSRLWLSSVSADYSLSSKLCIQSFWLFPHNTATLSFLPG